ncbi:hypothetical protein [Patiriisocius marinus]|uniref:Uncharacterized protein n=1 Tax=Patiriisocius marinus TaxID=1397112 RepID=A0A5J4J037_9FLAO|nr:hypothetical protein [Patiriisocius marinus]GER60674.1 hypothetical protein ULMA_27820 [Patiriisocius marinus]
MEPTNFEQQSREKFEEREMQPSNGAWGKLEQMLDEAQPKKKKSAFPWFAIAASFVGIAIIATVFFNRNTTEENKFVEQDINSEILKTETPLRDKTIINDLKEGNESVAITEDDNKENIVELVEKNSDSKSLKATKQKSLIASTTSEKPFVKSSQDSKVAYKKESAIAYNNVQNTNRSDDKKQITTQNAIAQNGQVLNISEGKNTNSKTLNNLNLDKQVDAVIAQVKQLKEDKKVITESDIDALLMTAQKELQLNRILNNKKVDAMALLGDVEMELNHSLRDKVFFALGEGFDYLKSTIVMRAD